MSKDFCKVLILLIIILSIILIKKIYRKYESIKEIELIDEYLIETKIDTTSTISTGDNKTTNVKKKTTKSNYLMILEIPKINLKKGIYNKNSTLNNVDKNIEILNSSDLPDKEKGSVILASHNGNTKVSFFKNLEELSNDDIVYIYYLGIRYTYKIYKSEIVDKVGNIKVTKDKNVSNIVLITCKNGTNDKQIVYIGRLITTDNY